MMILNEKLDTVHTKTTLAVLFSLMGLYVVIEAIRKLYFLLVCNRWPTAPARICYCQLMFNPGDVESAERYWIDAELEYRVEGRCYRRSIYGEGLRQHHYRQSEQAHEFMHAITASELLKRVHYNPKRHDQAYIKPGLSLGQLFVLGIGIAAIVIPWLFYSAYVGWSV